VAACTARGVLGQISRATWRSHSTAGVITKAAAPVSAMIVSVEVGSLPCKARSSEAIAATRLPSSQLTPSIV
jgi:hypothetical protein